MMMLWMVAAGCAVFSEPVPSTQGDGFFDRPWPDDRRLTAEGTLDLSDFPNRGEYELLEKFLDVAESLDGFGTNSPIYVHFPKKIRTDRLPTPEASLDPSASVILLDVDPRSPRRGEQIPIQWRWNDDETSWQAENLLAIAPVWGAPLDPRTTYAVILSTDIASPPDGFQDVWRTDHAEYAYYQPIQETLFQIGRELDTVAYAFAFTTQDPTAELARVVRAIDTWLPRPASEALDCFFQYPIHHLPVVRSGRLVGMLSSADVMKLQFFAPPGTIERAGRPFDHAPVPRRNARRPQRRQPSCTHQRARAIPGEPRRHRHRPAECSGDPQSAEAERVQCVAGDQRVVPQIEERHVPRCVPRCRHRLE